MSDNSMFRVAFDVLQQVIAVLHGKEPTEFASYFPVAEVVRLKTALAASEERARRAEQAAREHVASSLERKARAADLAASFHGGPLSGASIYNAFMWAANEVRALAPPPAATILFADADCACPACGKTGVPHSHANTGAPGLRCPDDRCGMHWFPEAVSRHPPPATTGADNV